MHHGLVDVLRQLRGHLAEHLTPPVIEDVCRQNGHTWRNPGEGAIRRSSQALSFGFRPFDGSASKTVQKGTGSGPR
jgi:hypothetical protein